MRNFIQDERGQAGLEYLLTISVAILLATIVFALTLQSTQIINIIVARIRAFRTNAILSAAE